MKITERTQAIQNLYDNESYHSAFRLAMNTIKDDTADGQENITLWCLMTNAYLNMLDPPEDAELDKTYADSYTTTFTTACCVEDVWEIRDNLWTAFNVWEANGYKKSLEFLCDNPTIENLNSYMPLIKNYAGHRFYLTVLYKKHPFEKLFMAKNHLSDDEYDEQYVHYGSQEITKEDRMLLQIHAAAKIFSKIKQRILNESRGSLDQVIDLVNYSVKALITADSLSTFSLDDCSKETQYQGHKLRAEILTYLFETYVYPDGEKMSLYQNTRQPWLDWLQESYDTLAELDPEFVPPEIPSVKVIKLADILPPEEIPTPTTPAPTESASSGGCYVATAVYGSYDCAQVWTLRRFRDYTLAETWYGRAFIRTYYAISPTLVRLFGDAEWFKKLWKNPLDRMVARLNAKGIKDTPYKDRCW